jgi:membrane protease subunit HflC
MQNNKLSIFILILAGFVLFASTCLFIVDETKTAIVLQFGNPKKVYDTAGLKVKLPYPFQETRFYDKRILNVDPSPERVNLKSDGENPLLKRARRLQQQDADAANELADAEDITEEAEIIESDPIVQELSGGAPVIVDTFARYRITDPLAFLQRLDTENNARQRIENIMNAATRDILGKTTLNQLLSPERSEIMALIRDRVNAEMRDRGVEIVDIRIVRADLTNRLLDSTVNRMITERKEQATKTRSNGRERAQMVRANADKERVVILANAGRDAQILRGEGDSEAINIYAKAFNKDPEFFAFIRSMEAYKTAFGDTPTRLLLSPDSDFLRYFKDRKK